MQVSPASGVPGDCYKIGPGEAEAVNIAEPEIPDIDDGVKHQYKYLGHGMCRGPNWTNQKWPILRGRKSLQDCANSCGRTVGCTAFDVSRMEDGHFDCMIYGHKHPVPAPGVPGDCYTVPGAIYVEEKPLKDDLAKERRSSILDEAEEEHTNIG